jgi:hypothetical protein
MRLRSSVAKSKTFDLYDTLARGQQVQHRQHPDLHRRPTTGSAIGRTALPQQYTQEATDNNRRT